MKLLNPRIDLAFKKISGLEKNKDLLISLINSIVSHEDLVVDIELLNPYNSRNFIKDKISRLRIYLVITMILKCKFVTKEDYEERASLCWAKLYADQLKTGDSYSSLRRAIGIHVLNFTSSIDCPDYHNKFIIMNQKTGLRFFKHLELHTIELNKFTHSTNENINFMLPRIKNGLDRWSTFLTRFSSLNKEHLPKELEDPCIKKALEVLENTYLNDEEREIYEGHLRRFREEVSALEKAESKGIALGKAALKAQSEKEKQEIARKLKSQGVSISIIQSATQLAAKEIEQL